MRTISTISLFLFLSLHLTAQVSSQPAIAFNENKGQVTDQFGKVNAAVRYLLSMPGMNVHLTAKGFSYDTYVADKTFSAGKRNKGLNDLMNRLQKNAAQSKQKTYQFHRIDILFDGASEHVQIIPGEMCQDYINYYDKNSGALIQVQQFKKIIYKNLYKGIDLELTAGTGKEQPFEYSFYVHPGADAGLIRVRYEGALSTQLSSKNSVLLKTVHGILEEKIPLSFEQETHKTVNVQYIQKRNGVFGFATGNYNRNKTLVIDPTPNRVWATYYGGSVDEYMNSSSGIAMSSTEDVYLAATSESASGIATAGAHQTTIGGGADAMLVKFNSSGVRQWVTYYGGTGNDEGYAVAVDASGAVILAGYTFSTTGIATAGSHQTVLGSPGIEDAFIAKFNSNGVRQWATYYGGPLTDEIFSLSVSGTDIYASGNTSSSTAISTAGSHQVNYGGSGGDTDGFFVKFNSSGVRQWGSYYGAAADDFLYFIHVDGSQNIYLAGGTESTTGIATAGSHQASIGASGFADGLIAKFNSSGVRQWATYYGGTSDDFFTDIKSDATGNVYACGGTSSTGVIATTGAHQTSKGTTFDGMLIKFSTNGVRQWGTYYGGTGAGDYLFSIHVLSDGSIFGAGVVNAAGNYATTDAYQLNFGGGSDDGILVKFNTNGVRQWGTYYGGNNYDDFYNIITYNGTTIYAAGTTTSTNAIASTGSHQPNFGGGFYNVFLVKFTEIISGVSQLSVQNGISIYPNPAKNEFVIKFTTTNTPASIELYDVTGKLVKSERVQTNINAPIPVNIKGLQTGTYLLKIWNAKKQLIGTEQLIVVE